MRLDVYQYSSPTTQKPLRTANIAAAAQTPEARRRNRMADIQQFKNERLVGEGHDGLLVIRKNPKANMATMSGSRSKKRTPIAWNS